MAKGASQKAAVARLMKLTGRAIIAASSNQGIALEGYNDHGVLSFAILEGLKGKAAHEDGLTTVNELAEFVVHHMPALTKELLSRTFFRSIDAIYLSMEDCHHETHQVCSNLSDVRFLPWGVVPLSIVLIGAVTEAMNFLHHRTGLDIVKIPKQLLSQHLLDRSLRGQSATAGAKVAGEGGPNRSMKLQRHELEHAQSHASEHDEALTCHPGLLYCSHMSSLGPLEVGVLFGLA
jgi:hypothetical protein